GKVFHYTSGGFVIADIVAIGRSLL
ncbi:hypothetical protein LCGC14_2723990, partial [marine sediment metagenome]